MENEREKEELCVLLLGSAPCREADIKSCIVLVCVYKCECASVCVCVCVCGY